ncbi:MAG: HAD hydrolase-like protein [Christensenellaceae bacterium]|jgi:phosphoglycolate phosphatase-like HAD superfamily hydrolase|nr:HAD hydrolase-like protein [Christensenellaceae bacterium]
MSKNEALSYHGQLFDLDGTLTPSINFPKNIILIKNFLSLQAGTLKLKEGAFDYLNYLKYTNKKLGLVSNMDEGLFKKYHMGDFARAMAYFESKKITGDISSKGNGKRDLILETLDEWKMKNDQAIYYGDTLKDAITCHDAKVKFCLVGNPKEKDLNEIKKISKMHIKSFTDLTF